MSDLKTEAIRQLDQIARASAPKLPQTLGMIVEQDALDAKRLKLAQRILKIRQAQECGLVPVGFEYEDEP